MKIQKSAAQYTDAALDEIQLLKEAKEKPSPHGDKFCVSLLDHFYIHGPHGKRNKQLRHVHAMLYAPLITWLTVVLL